MNFTNDVAAKLDECLPMHTEYFLVSDSGVKANLLRQSSMQHRHYLINLVGNTCEEKFDMFCKSIFSNITHIARLDVSMYKLTPFCVRLLVNYLQHCSVEKLIVQNSDYLLDEITNVLLDVFHTQKQVKNFIVGIPLIIVGCEKITSYLYLTVFFCNFRAKKSFDKVLVDLVGNEVYYSLQCVFLNVLKRNKTGIPSPQKFLSKFLAKIWNSLIVYEIDMSDRMAEKTLNVLRQQACFVLASQNEVSAYRVSANLCLKALADVAHT